MTYNVFGGTLSLTQSINQYYANRQQIEHTDNQHKGIKHNTSYKILNTELRNELGLNSDYYEDHHDDQDCADTCVCPGYYRCLRCLTESRLPSCIEQTDTATPPSALADTVLMLITRPLTLDSDNRSPFAYASSVSALNYVFHCLRSYMCYNGIKICNTRVIEGTENMSRLPLFDPVKFRGGWVKCMSNFFRSFLAQNR